MNKPCIHITDQYLLRPGNPITVNLIGAGGSGSLMLTALARMNSAMNSLGHPGLQVTVFDPDKVTTANLGRQLFTTEEVGLNKAVALISRINRFFGTNWKARPAIYRRTTFKHNKAGAIANLTISCVDTAAARFEIAALLTKWSTGYMHAQNKPRYWMDLGNGRDSGQVILSTILDIPQTTSRKYEVVSSLSLLTDEFRDLLKDQNDNDTPSCSLAEALENQDLFVNSAIVNAASILLWTMFRKGIISYRGVFINLERQITQPLRISLPSQRHKKAPRIKAAKKKRSLKKLPAPIKARQRPVTSR